MRAQPHRPEVQELGGAGAAADDQLRVMRGDEVEQAVGELLDAAVQQPGALLARDRVDEAHRLGTALGDVFVLELLGPREAEALLWTRADSALSRNRGWAEWQQYVQVATV